MEANRVEVEHLQGDIVTLEGDIVDELKRRALASPRRRARVCLHGDATEKVHEMLICMCGGAYVPPHRHFGKTESFHMVAGDMTVFIFRDDGTVERRIRMGPPGSGRSFMYRLSREACWHTVVPHSEFVIFHETTNGPFVPTPGGLEAPPWAPAEKDADRIKAFVESLMQCGT